MATTEREWLREQERMDDADYRREARERAFDRHVLEFIALDRALLERRVQKENKGESNVESRDIRN